MVVWLSIRWDVVFYNAAPVLCMKNASQDLSEKYFHFRISDLKSADDLWRSRVGLFFNTLPQEKTFF